ncbi:hypothetical protein E3AUHO_28470 [Klebsiella pneumoniae subsp. pneumoniae]|nr:hypothetical protein E3AUHO_28470 [Klebsiella pneumoniae subsp. pneumoniae]
MNSLESFYLRGITIKMNMSFGSLDLESIIILYNTKKSCFYIPTKTQRLLITKHTLDLATYEDILSQGLTIN